MNGTLGRCLCVVGGERSFFPPLTAPPRTLPAATLNLPSTPRAGGGQAQPEHYPLCVVDRSAPTEHLPSLSLHLP